MGTDFSTSIYILSLEDFTTIQLLGILFSTN